MKPLRNLDCQGHLRKFDAATGWRSRTSTCLTPRAHIYSSVLYPHPTGRVIVTSGSTARERRRYHHSCAARRQYWAMLYCED